MALELKPDYQRGGFWYALRKLLVDIGTGQATKPTNVAPLAGGADLPTTVAKVNELIAALKV